MQNELKHASFKRRLQFIAEEQQEFIEKLDLQFLVRVFFVVGEQTDERHEKVADQGLVVEKRVPVDRIDLERAGRCRRRRRIQIQCENEMKHVLEEWLDLVCASNQRQN